jgi:hypothetical protein
MVIHPKIDKFIGEKITFGAALDCKRLKSFLPILAENDILVPCQWTR